jgi:hypothetical protein
MRILVPVLFLTLSGICQAQTQPLGAAIQRDTSRPTESVVRPDWVPPPPDSRLQEPSIPDPAFQDPALQNSPPSSLGGAQDLGNYSNLGLGAAPPRPGAGGVPTRRCKLGESPRGPGGTVVCRK